MVSILKLIFSGITGDPKSTVAAIAPAIVGLIASYGFSVPVEVVSNILLGVYFIILLLWKKATDKTDVPAVDKSTVAAPVAQSAKPFDVSGIVSGQKGSDN